MKMIKCILKALLSTVALSSSIYNIYQSGLKQIPFEVSITKLPTWFIVGVGIILFALLSRFFYKEEYKENKYSTMLSLIFSISSVIGNGYKFYGSFLKLFTNWHVILAICNMVGYYLFFKYFIEYLITLIPKFLNKRDIKKNKLAKLFAEHPFAFSFCVLFVFWLIYYVAFYPIIMAPDPAQQVRQFLGIRTKYSDISIMLNDSVTITGHHPVFHTVLLGSCLKLGRYLVNDNFGFFIYSLIQGICLALTLCRSISFLKKRNIKNKVLFLILICYSIIPIFPLYALNANKDVFYSIFFMNLVMSLFEFIDEYKDKKYPISKCIFLFIIMIFLCLFRNNGIHIVLALCLFAILYSKINFTKMLCTFLLVIGLFFSYEKVLVSHFEITPTSPREKMSIFFQQTARLVKYKENIIEEKDKDVIRKVIDYDNLAKLYKPYISDPVKGTFNKYATNDDIKAYYKVWFKYLFKAPLTYVDATMNNIYGYFDPEDISWYTYSNYHARVNEDGAANYHYNSLSKPREYLAAYGALFVYVPVVGLLCNIAFSVWLGISFELYLIFKKKYKYLIVMIPFITSVLICMASPVNTYFRYAMPYVFCNLLLIGMWIVVSKKEPSK